MRLRVLPALILKPWRSSGRSATLVIKRLWQVDIPGSPVPTPRTRSGCSISCSRADNLSSLNRFAEAEEVFKGLERSEPGLYVVAFERGENLLNWGKVQAAVGELHRALALNPRFDQAWVALVARLLGWGRTKKPPMR